MSRMNQSLTVYSCYLLRLTKFVNDRACIFEIRVVAAFCHALLTIVVTIQ